MQFSVILMTPLYFFEGGGDLSERDAVSVFLPPTVKTVETWGVIYKDKSKMKAIE